MAAGWSSMGVPPLGEVWHLEEVVLHHVDGYPHVRCAQIRRLLGRMAVTAAGLVEAGETVEDGVDVREGSVKGS